MQKSFINTVLPGGSPEWDVRRTMAFMVMVFCFIMIPLGALVVVSDARADTLMTNSFAVLGGLVAVYITAAVIDDRDKRQSIKTLNPGDRVDETLTTTTSKTLVVDHTASGESK